MSFSVDHCPVDSSNCILLEILAGLWFVALMQTVWFVVLSYVPQALLYLQYSVWCSINVTICLLLCNVSNTSSSALVRGDWFSVHLSAFRRTCQGVLFHLLLVHRTPLFVSLSICRTITTRPLVASSVKYGVCCLLLERLKPSQAFPERSVGLCCISAALLNTSIWLATPHRRCIASLFYKRTYPQRSSNFYFRAHY